MPEQALRRARLPGERVFFTLIAAAVIVYVLVGFDRYYLQVLAGVSASRPIVHLHGLLFSTWVVLFLTQALLIGIRKPSIHRRLGLLGVVLALAMIVIGTIVTLQAAAGMPSPGILVASSAGQMVMFGVFVALAVHFRRQSAYHKRFMLLATVAIVDAAIGRWPFTAALYQSDPSGMTVAIWTYVIANLLIVAGVTYDLLVHRRVHPAYIWGGLALLASQIVRLTVADTEFWQDWSRTLASFAV